MAPNGGALTWPNQRPHYSTTHLVFCAMIVSKTEDPVRLRQVKDVGVVIGYKCIGVQFGNQRLLCR